MRRLFQAIWSMIDILMAVILAAMIALVFANVVLRYGFSSGIRQSVELARLWFVWIVMLGAAVVLRRGEHLAVAEFSEAMMPRAVPILRRLCWVVVMVAVGMLFIKVAERFAGDDSHAQISRREPLNQGQSSHYGNSVFRPD